MLNIINFKSKPKKTPFAPEWNYYIVETILNDVNVKKLHSFLLKKEKNILKLKKTNHGHTGLKNHTTTRHGNYNLFSFKNKEIDNLKNEIIKIHNKFVFNLNLKPVKNLYVKGWFNVMRKNEYIKPHIHSLDPDTYLGGHFCISCENTSTYYINSINQINEPETYESKNIPSKLTLFQNYIPHYTNKHRGKKERITIAFDLHLTKSNNIDIKLI